MKKINIIDKVSDTITNSAGLSFYVELEPFIRDNIKVTVSLKDIAPMSSSFLNSSIGELIDKYGYKKVAELLTFSNVSKFNANTIKKYFQALKDYA